MTVDLNAMPDSHLSEQEQKWADALESELNELWGLGRNLILVWSARGDGVEVLVIPHYTISEQAQRAKQEVQESGGELLGMEPRSFIEDVIANPKQVTPEGLRHFAELMEREPIAISLPFVPGEDLSFEIIENVVKRYSISYVEDRAVVLFDIVGYSLYSPLEQVTQLNSLAFSINSAYSKLLNNQIDINFARTTTGDGFYVWNRDQTVQANVNLYHFLHLVLADNAIARAKSSPNTTPLLRSCFHVGGHYEFYQSEGLSPTVFSYIVGDVTIELARMIDRATTGQVLVGDFWVPMRDRETGRLERIDTVHFIERAQKSLSNLEGLVLSGDEVEEIRCYLTGEKRDDGSFGIKRYRIADKHGRTRDVFNAKINIHRSKAEPIYLGAQSSELEEFKFESEEFV
jgi:hypothetical protein